MINRDQFRSALAMVLAEQPRDSKFGDNWWALQVLDDRQIR
jgi:hypothetical protein